MGNYKYGTFNVRGLRKYKKRSEFMHFLHKKKYDIAFLQETHGSEEIQKCQSTQWGTKIWFSNYNLRARGVAIMFNKSVNVEIHNAFKDL